MKKLSIYIGILLLGVLGTWALYTWHEVGNYPDKLWLHRCLSLEKFDEQKALYPNIELDLVIREDGTLDVTHDEPVSYGLTLDSFFLHIIKQEQNHRLWLDVKNLTEANQACFAQRIDSLCTAYAISRNQLIIESRNVAALRPLTEQGFYTSLYVDYENPSKLSAAQTDSCLRALQDVCDSHCVSALSFPGWWYDTLKEGLNTSIDLLTWKHRTTQWEFLLLPSNRKLLNDPQLKVVLLKSKGDYHR